jgi:DNA-binding CsgD family transcriptional regulator
VGNDSEQYAAAAVPPSDSAAESIEVLCDVVRRSRFPVGVYDSSTTRILAVSPSAARQLGLVGVDLPTFDPRAGSTDPAANLRLRELILEGRLTQWRWPMGFRTPDGRLIHGDALGRVVYVDGTRRVSLFSFARQLANGEAGEAVASDGHASIEHIDRKIGHLLGLDSRDDVGPPSRTTEHQTGARRVAELERHLLHIARELEAAGTIESVGRRTLPTAVPGLEGLSARKFEVLTRLLRGERVATISRRMFLSPSTVRNHLTAIYRRVGVGSQAELIELMQHAQQEARAPSNPV